MSKFTSIKNDFTKFNTFNISKKLDNLDYVNVEKPSIEIELVYNDSKKEIEKCESPIVEFPKIYNEEIIVEEEIIKPELKKEPSLKLLAEKLILQKKFKNNGWEF